MPPTQQAVRHTWRADTSLCWLHNLSVNGSDNAGACFHGDPLGKSTLSRQARNSILERCSHCKLTCTGYAIEGACSDFHGGKHKSKLVSSTGLLQLPVSQHLKEVSEGHAKIAYTHLLAAREMTSPGKPLEFLAAAHGSMLIAPRRFVCSLARGPAKVIGYIVCLPLRP